MQSHTCGIHAIFANPVQRQPFSQIGCRKYDHKQCYTQKFLHMLILFRHDMWDDWYEVQSVVRLPATPNSPLTFLWTLPIQPTTSHHTNRQSSSLAGDDPLPSTPRSIKPWRTDKIWFEDGTAGLQTPRYLTCSPQSSRLRRWDWLWCFLSESNGRLAGVVLIQSTPKWQCR